MAISRSATCSTCSAADSSFLPPKRTDIPSRGRVFGFLLTDFVSSSLFAGATAGVSGALGTDFTGAVAVFATGIGVLLSNIGARAWLSNLTDFSFFFDRTTVPILSKSILPTNAYSYLLDSSGHTHYKVLEHHTRILVVLTLLVLGICP